MADAPQGVHTTESDANTHGGGSRPQAEAKGAAIPPDLRDRGMLAKMFPGQDGIIAGHPAHKSAYASHNKHKASNTGLTATKT